MSTKVLIDSTQLWEILQRHPEVELDLLKNAVPQLAQRLAMKAKTTTEEVERLVDKAFAEAARDPSNRWGASQTIRTTTASFLQAECREEAKRMIVQEVRAEIAETARKEVNAALVKFGADLQKAVGLAQAEVDEYVRGVAEREVLSLLRAGKLTVAE